MRQIELIKGTAYEMAQLEELINDFSARTNGRVIDVTATEDITPTGVKSPSSFIQSNMTMMYQIMQHCSIT